MASGACLLAVLLALGPAAPAPDGAQLGVAGWRVTAPGMVVEGRALWLLGPDGAWRCDVGVAPATVADLQRRSGEGWTLTRPAATVLLHQAWDGPWREAGREDALALRRLLALWSGEAGHPAAARPVRRRWRPSPHAGPVAIVLPRSDVLPGVADAPGAGGDAAGVLRRRLVTRGRGRGGPGLVLELRREAAGAWRVTTRRWPVTLRLLAPAALWRAPVPPEAWLPVWSLADLGVAGRP